MEVEEEIPCVFTLDSYIQKTDLHPLLSDDMGNLRQLHGEEVIRHYVTDSEEVLLRLRLHTDHFDIAKARGTSEPLFIHLVMNPKEYLDAKCKPEIAVVPASTEKMSSVRYQMQNILTQQFNENWQKWSNESLESALGEHRLAINNRTNVMELREGFSLVQDNDLNCQQSKNDKNMDHDNSTFRISTKLVHSVLLRNLSNGWLSMIYEYCRHRLNTLNECCVVCDEPHGVPMSTPRACSRPLCEHYANLCDQYPRN